VNRTIGVLAIGALVAGAACSKNNEKTTADTMTKRGVDTVSGGNVLPTTDTIVKKTTTTTDTLHGSATDSAKARADSIARRDSIRKAKKKGGKKG